MKQELIFHSLSVSKAIRTYKFCIWCCMQTHKSIMLIKTLSTNDVILHLQFSLLCEFLLKNWSQLDIFHPENISYTRKSWYGTCCISLKRLLIFSLTMLYFIHICCDHPSLSQFHHYFQPLFHRIKFVIE